MVEKRKHDGREPEDRRSRRTARGPTGKVSGRRASTIDMISAPTAGAARSSPGPTARS